MISLVVPAYNEERYLPRLLDSVDAAAAAWRDSGGGELEVIVADNGSTDGTARLAGERGCRVAPATVRAIAAARNAGARAARGEILVFVDADARIHPQTFLEISRLLSDPGTIGGATGVRMERRSLGIAATYAAFMPLVWTTGFDTGPTFCRRADFDAVGGYDERLRYAEDVKFLYELWRLGRRTGRHLVRARRAKAIYSTRKFDEHGDWHYFRLFWHGFAQVLGFGHMDEVVDRYWYRPSR